MTDRPILFSAPMVRALLDGRKTMTRRVIKPQPRDPQMFGGDWFDMAVERSRAHDDGETPITKYTVGDRLWVREAWKPHSLYDHMKPRDIPATKVFYLADDGYSPSGSRGRPSMFMPRWASRLTLTVTGVKVERLRDISEKDARAEGVESRVPMGRVDLNYAWRQCFRELWLSINGPGSWEANPWVRAVSFTVERRNIDARP